MKTVNARFKLARKLAFYLITAIMVWSACISGAAASDPSTSDPSASQSGTSDLFQDYLFNDLKVTNNSVPYKYFPSNSTVQLEANTAGQTISFEFSVEASDVYDIHLRPWRAPSYARYNVLIDGQLVKEVDFYGTTNELEYLTAMKLEKGHHIITFEYSGRTEGSSNYKMGVIEMFLVSQYSAAFTDLKESARSEGLETSDEGAGGYIVKSEEPGSFIEFELPVDAPRTYGIRVEGIQSLHGGMAEVLLDGASLGTIDFYGDAGNGTAELISTKPLETGIHKIRLKVIGKNENSEGFHLPLKRVSLSLTMLETEKTRRVLDRKIGELQGLLETVTDKLSSGDAAEDQTLRSWLGQLSGPFSTLLLQTRQPDLTLKGAEDLLKETEKMSWPIKRLANYADARVARPYAKFGLAAADAMNLVYPRDLPCLCSTDQPAISLAKGEYESLQAVVMAYGDTLHNVRAQITQITGPDGREVSEDVLAASVAPLGSVNIKKSRYYTLPALANSPSNYQGWIPDPIRSDLAAVDVSAGDLQPFWIELHAGRKANPGLYKVKVSISAEGAGSEVLEIQAKVWPFDIPDRPELATSITTNPVILNMVYKIDDQAEFDRMNEKYIDFLETFKIEPDLLYRRTPPTVEELLKIKNKWGLRQFNAYYIYPGWLNLDVKNPETWQPEIDRVINEIGAAMEQYEQAGLADLAYIYGFDEIRAEDRPLAKAMFGQIKQRFPNLPIMMTYLTRNLALQQDLVGLVDIWVPGMQNFEPSEREKVQMRGDQLYWFTAIGVKDPFPNWFNGYWPGDTRMMMGPMSHKMKVDGYLYYNITRWINQGVMNDGILSEWDARTLNDAYGDGSLFYPGPEGPLASQRIQNFRDGMEDYNLLNKLRAYIDGAIGIDEATLSEARGLLNADAVVTDPRTFTKDPVLYRQWREAVANMLVRLDPVAPNWPEGSKLTVTEATYSSLTVQWPAAVDNRMVDSYRIYLDGSELPVIVEHDGSDLFHYTVTGLEDGTPYTISVKAIDSVGNVSEALSQSGTTVTSSEIIQNRLNAYMASGEVQQPLASQLTNHLDQAIHHWGKGQTDPALHSLNLFLTQMSSAEHADKISSSAKERLNASVQTLINQWKEASE